MPAKSKQTSKTTASLASDAGIGDYAWKQAPELAAVFQALRAEIDAALPRAASKIWHGAPVWFVDDYPVVGYSLIYSHIAVIRGQIFGNQNFCLTYSTRRR